MTHDIDLVKEFSNNSPNPSLFRHSLIAADELMTLLESEAANKGYNKALKTADDYTDAYLYLNCFTFKDWNSLLESEKEMREFRLDEQQLQKLIGKRIFQLNCGYWVQFS